MKVGSLFISHSWSYGDDYTRLIALLNAVPRFVYRDYSVPKDDPVHNATSVQALYDAIKRKVSLSQIVIIMGGKYATYSKWISREIDIAKKDFNKPILAIKPYGNTQVSSIVSANASQIVNWSTSSVVAAIRELVP